MQLQTAIKYERGEPWFEDGNIVLLADQSTVAFKVHRGVLSRHSEIFQSMFQLPPPSQSEYIETVDGCQLVRMYDLPADLSNLIKALYDGPSFQNRSARDFYDVAGVLRLSNKYFIAHLRSQAIRFLSKTWSCTLRGHDAMLQMALDSHRVDGLTYPYVHPLHVLKLARETNAQVLVPSALYFLSLYPLQDITRGDHPKLQVEHPSRPSPELSAQDLQDYTLMFQHRIDLMLEFVQNVDTAPGAGAMCTNRQGDCYSVFSRLANVLSRSWLARTGPLHFMVQAVDQLAEDPTACHPCHRAFREHVFAKRQQIWDELPSIVGLPNWEELKASDLGSQP
ncbi:uncharacterized protein LAESUDRAFT_808972 [Laetiporus sulphureus 93-53]|uniref:BTB domain-containing protein n=1 Tax=Laetiporus sulphureus 93-53 TaxID=1314785 RepID=A0A165HR83_9APHY|nr:uncharacterized protein LAESUDRAFT_808972 [Laetiporus sulphureus 93-53]KZT12074.1 hypothetical protein LAESUDRAFT_808972 [Laetiporus sulphureus 93-53]